MWIPKEIGRMEARLKEGHRVNKISVRELLQLFKAERRGLNKVQEIRAALDSLGLETEPDFEAAWIDEKVKIRFKQTSASSQIPSVPADEEDEQDELSVTNDSNGAESPTGAVESDSAILAESEGIVETLISEGADPTFRIGSLPAANKLLTTVGQDDDLKKAITKMLQYDYSQLPIMQGEREVKGMISWKSIAAHQAIGGPCPKVRDCREDAQVVDANGTLFDAIPTIVRHGYVLVRSPKDRRITGIVTSSDLSLQFQQLAEPFLLIREIELHIRQLLGGKLTEADLFSLTSPDAGTPSPKTISDLSFGGYVRLIQKPDIWCKLSLNIDQASLTAQMEDVRKIRNDVMHFDPDPLTSKQLGVLKNAAKFMQNLYELLP